MKALLVFSIFVTSSLCALLSTDMIASVHLIENDQYLPLSEIYQDLHTLKHRETAVVSLKFGDRHYVIDLVKGNDIVSPDFVHVNREDEGTEKQVEHNLFEHCAYHGHVRGEQYSAAHILTCGGVLRGSIDIPHESINIVQKEGQTVVSLLSSEMAGKETKDEMEIKPTPLAETEIDLPSNFSTLKRQSRENGVVTVLYFVSPSAKKRYIELGWTVQDAVRTELFIADRYFQKIGLGVQIVAIIESPEISQPKDSENDRGSIVLRDFYNYHSKIASPKRDWSWYRNGLQNVGVGKASALGRICRADFPGGSGQIVGDKVHIQQWAATFVHELGHSVGMDHDSACCDETKMNCIMSAWLSTNEGQWTSCAIKDFKAWLSFINERKLNCLAKTACTYDQWGPWQNAGKCGGEKFRLMKVTGPCIAPREAVKNPACPKAVLEAGENSIKNSDTNSVSLLIGVTIGCSVLVAVVVVVAIVAVVLSRKRNAEERA